jgi:Leucine-rich repeat (LRR) protein/subtilisin family serine protease
MWKKTRDNAGFNAMSRDIFVSTTGFILTSIVALWRMSASQSKGVGELSRLPCGGISKFHKGQKMLIAFVAKLNSCISRLEDMLKPLPRGLQARPFFCFLLGALLGLWAVPLSRAQELPVYEPQVVIVQVEPGVAIAEGAAKTGLAVFDLTAARYGVHTIERVFPFLDHVQPTPKTRQNLAALRRTYYARYSAADDPEWVAKALAFAPGVIYAEPVIINRPSESEVRAEPDDSLFSDQTYLRHLRLPEAWDIVKGEDMSPPVVIAIVDSGSDWQHEDLLANVWTNVDEIPGNGIDDDNNGFIDDMHGANFCDNDDTNNDPFNPRGSWHGTTVAGTASGATNNGIGVAGAAWNAQLMHICGVSYRGILYAAANGADIINASWIGGGLEVSTFRAQSLDLATDMGALVVSSAGNANLNSDMYRFYPSAFPRVLSVGATAKDSRERASFSNYGRMVNVFAPGVDIITTAPDGEYVSSASGTSFSSPLVSGVAALVKTRYPDISPDALREQIRLASEPIDSENPGQAGHLGHGYVNAEASLRTPAFPAVRLKRWTWDDTDSDRIITSGEEVTIKAVVINHLADAQRLRIGLTAAESYPYIDLSNTEQMVGHLARGDSAEVTLRFVVANNAPPSRLIRFYTRIRDGAFVDEPDRLSFGINARIELYHAALSALYTSTGGHSWRANRNWDITTVPTPSELSQWYGVLVTHGILSRLDLCRNNLTGILPSVLGNLEGLENLLLCDNSLSGEIPRELSNLTQLQGLELDRNSLTGEIPSELGILSRLQKLKLNANSLTERIPSELGNLSQLQTLELSDNLLTGEIPHELGNLTQLLRLHLSGNSLSGGIPRELGNLVQLQRLWLDGNSLSGGIPRELGNLVQLQRLRLDGNSFSGEIPYELGNLTQLQGLELDGNSFSGGIPRELGNLTQLHWLYLSRNSLSGEIPHELSNLSQLQTLVLSNNSFSGEIPHELGSLTQLQQLNLRGNSLSGELPRELGNLSQLQRLGLSDNSLSGEIHPELGNLTQLQLLSLRDNQLTGTIPSELGNLTQLEWLLLGGNSLTGEIPVELGNLSQLHELNLRGNQLTGTIPSELGNLSQLTRLYLHNNFFTGRLPRSFMQLTNLEILSFGGQDLCAPGDDAFQMWLSNIPRVDGPTCSGIHFADNVADQSFPRAQPIVPVVLPEATGGAPPINYTLTPILPTGIAFDQANRTLSGSPTVVTPATPYAYKAIDTNGSTDSLSFSIEVYSPTSAEHESLPEAFALHGNFPNPFRHTTQLLMDLPWPARVIVEVIDVIGRRVLMTPATDLTAGWQRSVNLNVTALPSGLYLYRVHASLPGGRVVHAGRFIHAR